MRIRSRTRALAAAAATALLLAACAAGDDADTGDGTTDDAAEEEATDEDEEPEPGEGLAEGEQGDGDVTTAATLRAAIVGDEGTLNPETYVTGFPGWNLLMLQYDSLMQIDQQGVPQPWLAEQVDVSDDGTTYTLTLADGVTWHDGEAFDAEDVVFTFEYFPDSTSSRFSRAVAGVESVEATDATTVTLTLSAPNPAFPLSTLADVPIVPEHVWSTLDDPTTAGIEANVGTGPYVLTEYDGDQSYRMAANPDYFRGAPAVDELVLVQFADDSGTQAAIRSGEVDVVFNRIAPEQVELLDQQDPIDVVQGPEFTTDLLYYDTTIAPFDDVVVRTAMMLAADRQDLVDTVHLGAATVGSPGWIHPQQPVHNEAVQLGTDVEEANRLLDEAGYLDSDGDGVREYDGEPMSFELITPADRSLRLRAAELLVGMLADIGIEVQVASVEAGTWEDAVWPGFDVTNGRSYQLAMWGWSAPIQANPSRIVSLVHSDPSIGNLNLTGYADEQMDELALALSTETDPVERERLLDELQVRFAETLPFITLLYPNGAYAFDSSTYDAWSFVTGQGIVTKLSLLPESARP